MTNWFTRAMRTVFGVNSEETTQPETRVISSLFGIPSTSIQDGNAPWLSYQGMMQIPGAYRAAMLIADLFAALPWDAYRDYGGNPTEKLSPRPIVLEQPNPQETRATAMTSMVLDYLWHGNAIAIIMTRDSNGYPTSYLPVPADWVSVRRVPNETNYWLPSGEIEYRVGDQVYSQHDILHIKGPCRPSDLRGMGVLELHCKTLNLSQELSDQAAHPSMRGVPTGVLSNPNPDAEPTDLANAKLAWQVATMDNTVAVIGGGTTFQPIGWNPDQRQLIESRKFSLTEIALIFGVPFSMLGAESGGTMTYANTETEANSLLKFNLVGHISRWEQALSLLFPRGTYVLLDRDDILQGDTLTRYQAYQIGLNGGWLTVDDIRTKEKLPPLPEQSESELEPNGDESTQQQADTGIGASGDTGGTTNPSDAGSTGNNGVGNSGSNEISNN